MGAVPIASTIKNEGFVMDKIFVLVVSMWGNTGSEWLYIGNQYVYHEPMTFEECQPMSEEMNWSSWEDNQFYRVQFDCMNKDK